jgi:hypothetical protein
VARPAFARVSSVFHLKLGPPCASMTAMQRRFFFGFFFYPCPLAEETG